MAEREAINKRYAYQEMSNKVQQADRSLLRPRGNDEPTGEVETLVGRTDIGRMGDRVGSMVEKETNQKKRPQEIIEKMERVRQKKQKKHSSKKNSWTTTTTTSTTTGGGKSILDLTNITGYQPSHPGSQAVYENMLVRMSYTHDDELSVLYCTLFQTHLFTFFFFFQLYIRCSISTCIHVYVCMYVVEIEFDWIKRVIGNSTNFYIERCSRRSYFYFKR